MVYEESLRSRKIVYNNILAIATSATTMELKTFVSGLLKTPENL